MISSYLRPAAPVARMPPAAESVVHVNAFTVDYRPDGQVAQYFRWE